MKRTLITEMIRRLKKIWTDRSVGNMSTNVCTKFRCAALRIKKALWIFRELITTRTTTRVAFWDPPSGFKNKADEFTNLVNNPVIPGSGPVDTSSLWRETAAYAEFHNEGSIVHIPSRVRVQPGRQLTHFGQGFNPKKEVGDAWN